MLTLIICAPYWGDGLYLLYAQGEEFEVVGITIYAFPGKKQPRVVSIRASNGSADSLMYDSLDTHIGYFECP